MDPFFTAGLILALVHFGIPLAYYWYAKTFWLPRPWNIKVDQNYRPKVTVIVPTYNEAETIEEKLENLYAQEYPRDLLEVIVVDGASTDGTDKLVEKWRSKHTDFKLKLLREQERRGMIHGINYALRNCRGSTEIVLFTDADAYWDVGALRNIVKYFADFSVGAVSASIVPDAKDYIELVYRNYYNTIRVAESKMHSTPIHNGPLIAFRYSLLYSIGSLPDYTGNDDSTPASLIAFMGYRAIQVDDVIVRELVRGNQFKRKVRRAQHLILHFLHTKRYAKKLGVYRDMPFNAIWRVEWWLHTINPLLLPSGMLLLLVSVVAYKSLLAASSMLIGFAALVLRPFRTWLLQQLHLMVALVKNLWSKEIIWER